MPAVVATREAVQAVIPPLPAAPPPLIDPRAVDLIVAFEVSGRAHYERRLQGVIWPGGASGATWGIGYDGGHQTRIVIADDWAAHAHVERLASTAGIVGERARALLPGLADVRTAWALAHEVFVAASLPVYHARARRAFGAPAFDALPPPASGALVSLVYNRGTSMSGDARREMRAIRDDCLPVADVDCIARELRSMCRLWAGAPNGAGLCRRRHAEADLARAGHESATVAHAAGRALVPHRRSRPRGRPLGDPRPEHRRGAHHRRDHRVPAARDRRRPAARNAPAG